MTHEIVMPQLSLSMDKGQIVCWLKQTGDKVTAGDILLEVESDKATVEVEAVESGILQIVLDPTSGEISVGEVIAFLRAENETLVVNPTPRLPTVRLAPANENIVAAPTTVDIGQRRRRLPSSPAARRRAAELKVDWQQVTGSGRGGRIKERDVLRFVQDRRPTTPPKTTPALSIQLTPVARRIADDFGVTDKLLVELFPGKTKIEREDVENAIRQVVRERQSAPSVLTAITPAAQLKQVAPRREALGAVRKRIAERMRLSVQTYAPVTLTTEIDATELLRLRETWKSDPQLAAGPSFNVLFTKIAGHALQEYPELNASLDGGEIVYWPKVNIGVAVDTKRGLVVPVTRDVTAKSIHELSHAMNDLLGRAAQGRATADELTGGTFTITNLGVNDIDAFTPLINPPECAVLGIGRLRKQMVVIDDQPAVRTMLVLSLTFDHRLIDGAPAARFLQRVKQLCEQPALWRP